MADNPSHTVDDRSAAGRAAYAVEVALDGIDFKKVRLDDPLPLGRQILAAAGLRPVEDHQLHAIVANGDFEDVRLDEQFDLRGKGAERFVAFRGDREFRLTVDGREAKWGLERIQERALRVIGDVPEDHDVFLEVRGGTDRRIAPGEEAELSGRGVERFISAPRYVVYVFLVNGKRYETDQRFPTGHQIKATVPNWDPAHDLVLEGADDEPDRVIGDDETVDLRTEHGHRRFSSVPKANFG